MKSPDKINIHEFNKKHLHNLHSFVYIASSSLIVELLHPLYFAMCIRYTFIIMTCFLIQYMVRSSKTISAEYSKNILLCTAYCTLACSSMVAVSVILSIIYALIQK